MRISIYLRLNDARDVALAGSLGFGFKAHGDEVEALSVADYVQPNGDTQIAVIIGLSERNKKIFEDHRRAARHTLLIGKSYFGGDDYVSVVLDGFQPRYAHATPRQADRLDRIGIKFAPLRARGKHVIYSGASQDHCDWHALGDMKEFDKGICHAINKQMHSERNVCYRPAAPMADKPTNTVWGKGALSDHFRDCYAFVTHGSSSEALAAIAAGIPAILISHEGVNAAFPLAEKSLEDGFHNPFFPSDKQRRQVFADLSYCQFTIDEIASGLAWETLIPHTAKGLATGLSAAEYAIEQYKLMHKSPKMFRGASMKGHTEAVADIVNRYQLKTLLDYGSGKGEQYDKMHLHDRWGGIRPTCYDPGYPPIAEKPKGKFDGVICLDVAEHIPEVGIDDFLRDVVGYADKVALFCVFTELSRKFLPNGENCHLTVREPNWWIDRLAKATDHAVVDHYDIRKPLPGGGFEEFRHTVLQKAGGPDVVITFRGSD